MNVHEEGSPYCYFHPKELVVGICALCLRERLLVLASKQGNPHNKTREPNHRTTLKGLHQRKLSNPLPKVFALASFLHRLEFRHRAPNDSDQDTSTSREDSFISIKFEENGRASWENGTNSKQQTGFFDLPNCDHKSGCKEVKGTATATKVTTNKSVVEHVKARTMLRWRKRIGHLFQVMRLKRSSKGSTSHVACKMEGVKGRKGWIRSLTRRNME